MNLKALWQRCGLKRRVRPAARPITVKITRPKPFQPLTHNQSVAILDDTIQWLIDEARMTLAMPDGPAKQQRWVELEGRDQSLVRDFQRLVRSQQH